METQGWVVQAYPQYFESEVIIRCDDPLPELAAAARRRVQSEIDDERRRRRLLTGGSSPGAAAVDAGTLQIDMDCVVGEGCTAGADAIKLMYDAGIVRYRRPSSYLAAVSHRVSTLIAPTLLLSRRGLITMRRSWCTHASDCRKSVSDAHLHLSACCCRPMIAYRSPH